MTLANAHALFNGLKSDPSYLANLTIADADHNALIAARNDIRATLREKSSQLMLDKDYLQNPWDFKVTNQKLVPVKFMMQGSFAYKTLNVPARVPKQEIDLDDGMYVPIDFLESGEPILAAKGLFSFVEKTLSPLCKAKGWTLDNSKSSCVRVLVWPGAHIDIPIYSVPNDKFALMTDAIQKAELANAMGFDSITKNFRIPSDQIMLAKREGKWEPSDPQQLRDWIDQRCDRYGPIYKRLCRFFKGWRDYTWESSPLSSLCIMCSIDKALTNLSNEIGLPSDSRDDVAIMEVAKRLPGIFNTRVENPVLKNLYLNDWEEEDRQQIVGSALFLSNEISIALEKTGDPQRVVDKLRDNFGNRIPLRPDVVKIGSKISSVLHAEPAKVAAPKVIASTSGSND